MAKRFDVAAPREYTDRDGNKKTSWNNLGVAFEKDGKISILLNALPMPGPDGQAKLILMEPKERDDRGSSGGSSYGSGNGGGGASRGRQLDPFDDDVPFASCDPSYDLPRNHRARII